MDAVLCTLLVGASRLTLRLLPEARARRRHRRRVLIVGAGHAGRGLARELRDTHEARVLGFLDDNPRVRRRRILGVSVLGGLDEAPRAIAGVRAEEVLVTIPDAPRERLDAVVRASEEAGIPCRIVRRVTEFTAAPAPGRGDAPVNERRSVSARLLAAIPLLTLYFGLAALYAWQASRHPVPTIYSDEIELAWLSRSIAETGEAARRGDPYGLATLVAYFLAPVWWVGSAATGYAAAKLLLVLAMTATVFPAYALARLVVPPWYALAAAGGATIVPALAYSPILVEEPLAYPLATLALWLIARVYVEPTWGRAALAVLACTAAMLTRTQLSILFALFVLGLLWLCWQSERSRAGARRSRAGTGSGSSRSESAPPSARRRSSATSRRAGATRPARIRSGSSSTRPGRRALSRSGSESFRCSPASRHSHGREARRRSEDARVRHHERLRARRLRRVRGHQGRADLDHVLDPRRRAEPDLPLPDPLRRDRARVRPRGRARLGDRRRDGLHRVRRHRGAAPARQLPVLRGARALAAGVPEPGVGLARGTDREHAARRVLRLRRRARRAPVSPSRLDASSPRSRRRAAVAVFAWTLTAEVYAAEGERRLARQIADNLPAPYDWVDRATGGGSVVDPRSADDRRPDGRLPHRVLQPLGQEGVEHRRDGARPGRDPHPRPRERRRHAHAVARDRLRAHAERRRAAGAGGQATRAPTSCTTSTGSRSGSPPA